MEFLKDTPRKLHINFHISTFLGSAPSSMCLQSIIMESKRTLEVLERSIGGFGHGGCPHTKPHTYNSSKYIQIKLKYQLKSTKHTFAMQCIFFNFCLLHDIYVRTCFLRCQLNFNPNSTKSVSKVLSLCVSKHLGVLFKIYDMTPKKCI